VSASPAIEVVVLSASTNETKKSGKTRKVTFLLPNDGPHPFEGMGGERFHIVCVRVNDDETPAEEPEKLFPRIDRSTPLEPPPKERRKARELPLSSRAALRVKDPEFQSFMAERRFSAIISEPEADRLVKQELQIDSKSEITPGSLAHEKWLALDSDFWAWQRGMR
jgi:hypothetical protein